MLSRLKIGCFRQFKCVTDVFPRRVPALSSGILSDPLCKCSVDGACYGTSSQLYHQQASLHGETSQLLQGLTAPWTPWYRASHREASNHKIEKADDRLTISDITSSDITVLDDTDNTKALTEQINQRITDRETGRLFAVVQITGKQRKITSEDILVLGHHMPAEIGDRIRLNKVLLVGSKDFTLVGRPVLSLKSVRVEATVIEKTLSHTRVRFRYLRRQNNKKMKLKKERYTHLRINSIELSELSDGEHTPTVDLTS